ncbi:hypothetical protein B0H67DRAFT_124359 [Lasiosphaeris hirsuta]|uniref:Uncharacterized protein n=1 Tax=Lasiosphaeris hirsuta TaxID=260670 RepID=A0AA40B087_9PEZI|nr:hypothetical protein B0H67DRAFT_124359 [Lasiosphaeris hirsuta]
MGQYFGNAYLVIAAAGATDYSTRGLFNSLRYPHLSAKVPYYDEDDPAGHMGTFHVTMASHFQVKPSHGPLCRRAWVA